MKLFKLNSILFIVLLFTSCHILKFDRPQPYTIEPIKHFDRWLEGCYLLKYTSSPIVFENDMIGKIELSKDRRALFLTKYAFIKTSVLSDSLYTNLGNSQFLLKSDSLGEIIYKQFNEKYYISVEPILIYQVQLENSLLFIDDDEPTEIVVKKYLNAYYISYKLDEKYYWFLLKLKHLESGNLSLSYFYKKSKENEFFLKTKEIAYKNINDDIVCNPTDEQLLQLIDEPTLTWDVQIIRLSSTNQYNFWYVMLSLLLLAVCSVIVLFIFSQKKKEANNLMNDGIILPRKIFFSYSRKDKIYRNELDKHFSNLKKSSKIETWCDYEILAGKEWEKEIMENLNSADIILLMISADFNYSRYCSKELEVALKKHKRNEAMIIPIIVRPCDWKNSELAKLNALPTAAKPIVKWSLVDDAYVDIVNNIKRILESN